MQLHRGIALAIIIGGVAAVAACRDGAPTSGAAPRVVSLHDVTTEIVVALDATDQLVGVAEPVDGAPGPVRAIAAVPRVAGLESIAATRPDVVLGLGVVEEQDPELVARLRADGVEVVLGDPATLDDLDALIDTIARRVGARTGDRVIADLRARVTAATVTPARRRRVFVYDCCEPPFTAGGRTVETELIARAGGDNVFAGLDVDWGHVAWEEVVARRPELIVVHAYRWDGQGDVEAKRRALRAIPTLGAVPVAIVPLGSVLGGLRSVDGLERLRAAIGAVE
ncbi:MAG TPA: helical backbone metal receptor [Kofleriaceae bacterium]|nr:helical backbone metal receptor [Kofleriaceae bacterium]